MSNALRAPALVPLSVAPRGWPTEDWGGRFEGQAFDWPQGEARVTTSVLRTAVGWWDARLSPRRNNGQVLGNLGYGGYNLDARFGSTSAPDTNDPTDLPWNGQNYVFIGPSNSLSVPHSAGAQVADTMEWRLDLANVSYTLTAQASIVTKHQTSVAVGSSWRVIWQNASLRLIVSDNITQVTPAATVGVAAAASLTAGERVRLKVNYVRNTGSGNYSATFWWSKDFTSALAAVSDWTLIGSTVTGASIGATNDSTASVRVGESAAGGSQPQEHNVYRVQHSLNGAAAYLDINTATDATSAAATSFTATSGQTVTVNRASTGKKLAIVTRPVLLFGTDDYLEVPHNALIDFDRHESLTLCIARRAFGTPTSQALVTKRATVGGAGGSAGWDIRTAGGSGYLAVNEWDNGTALTGGNSPTGTAGTLHLYSAVMTPTSITGYLGTVLGSIDARSGSARNTLPFRVGATSVAGSLADMEFLGAAIFRRALTTAELAVVAAFYA